MIILNLYYFKFQNNDEKVMGFIRSITENIISFYKWKRKLSKKFTFAKNRSRMTGETLYFIMGVVMKRNFDIPENLRIKLGKYIRATREKKGFGLNQTAIKAGINIADLHKIENASKNKVNPYQLKAIAEALKIDYKKLYIIVGYLEEKDFENNFLKLSSHFSKHIDSTIGTKENSLLSNLTFNEKEQVKNFINFLKSQKKKVL